MHLPSWEVAIGDFNFKWNVDEGESTAILLQKNEKNCFIICKDDCPHKDIMGVALTQKQNDVQKEYITLLQSFEKDGFDYAEKLIESDEQDKLCLIISGKPENVW